MTVLVRLGAFRTVFFDFSFGRIRVDILPHFALTSSRRFPDTWQWAFSSSGFEVADEEKVKPDASAKRSCDGINDRGDVSTDPGVRGL